MNEQIDGRPETPAGEPAGSPVPAPAAPEQPAVHTSTETQAPGRRSRRHEGRRPWLVWALVVLVVAALATGGYFAWRQYDRTRSAQAELDAAAALLDGAEADLLVVDAAVQAEISSEIATQALDALALTERVRADALAAVAILDEVDGVLRDDVRPIADALRDSAQARAEMMIEAPVILEADRKAALAMVPADKALTEIKAAEESITKAVAEFNKHTAEGVRASTANSEDAAKRLTEARSLLATATAAFPEADYTAFVEYIDAKLALIKDSKEIDSLWLAGKIEESNQKLDAYNKRDAEIVAMAKKLPESVRDPIADAYEKITADARTRYFEARERARAAGERVRELKESAAR